MSRLDLLPAGFVVGRYQVLDLLGQGGMAAVYRVRHQQLGSLHALKVVTVPSRSILHRLTLEGQAQARVRHRHIVAVHDVLEVEGSPGLLMEFVDGPTLEELLDHPLPLSLVDHLARGLLKGVAAAHAAGLVHRDLKPANVLVATEEDGLVPKVADFGLVKDAHAGESRTRSGTLMGTPNYMAPEQIRDAKSVDHRADVFALGAILYELLVGQRAFDGDDVLFIFNQVANGDYQPASELRPEAPERMVQAIDAALQTEVEERAASVQALLELWCGDVDDLALQGAREPLTDEIVAVIEASRRPVPVVSAPPPIDPTFADPTDPGPGPTLTAPDEAGVAHTFVSSDDEQPPHVDEAVALPSQPSPPARRRRLVGLALLATLLVGGLGGLGLVGAVVLWTAPADRGGVAAEAPEPAPRPVEARPAAPVAPAPAPAVPVAAVPVPDPAPVPVEPSPVPAPTVAPEAPGAPEAAPKEQEAPVPAPVPVPSPSPARPEPSPTASVQVRGDVDVLLVPLAGGAAVRPSAVVPAGDYAVTGSMADGEPPVRALTLELSAGDAVVLHCVRALRRCTRK